jgi:hypothetical protein
LEIYGILNHKIQNQSDAEYRRTLSDELAKSEQKASGLAQDLIKAEQKTKLQKLTAPVDGVVQQLAIHTVGGVVTPAQALLMVVPSESRLEIEAMVSNRDIGFVQAGQDAEIKVDTLNFTRYGLLHGKVLSVSQDAIIRERKQDRLDDRGAGSQNDTSEPQGQELSYSARISLDRAKMQIDKRMVVLVNGYATAGGPRFACIFQQGASGPWVARHGLTSAQYQAAFNEFTSQGYVLDWVSGYFDGSQDLYAAIWRRQPNAPAWEARHGLTSAQYQAFFNAITGKGYKPVVVCGYGADAQDRYAAIFRNSECSCVAGASRLNARPIPSGVRPIRQSRLPARIGQWLYRWRFVGGQDRIAAIWTR